MNLFGAIVFISLTTAMFQPAQSPLQEVGRWSLAQTEHSCSIQAFYQDGTTLRVIASDVDTDWSFVFLNPNWKSVDRGRPIEVEVQFPGFAKWSIGSIGLDPVEAGHAFGFQQDSREEFVAQFALAETLVLFRGGLPVTSLSMTNSRRAVQELTNCQVGLRTKPNFDPFHTVLEAGPGDAA